MAGSDYGGVFDSFESGVHTAQHIDGVGGSGGLFTGELPEITVYEAHQAETAEGHDFTGIISQQAEVISKRFAHTHLIQPKPRSCNTETGLRGDCQPVTLWSLTGCALVTEY